MKTTKRLLGIVLALAMLLTMASFPAFADESYTYTPKDIVLEASMATDDTWGYHYSDTRIIAKPSDYNIFVGDKFVLPEGGLAMRDDLPKISVSGTKVLPTGIAIDFFQSYSGITGAADTAQDGIKRFYFKLEYPSSNPNGVFTGIYPTAADMEAGTNKLDGIELKTAGFWAAGIRAAVYNGTNYLYSNSANQGYNAYGNNGNPYIFTFEVREQPTTPDYIVTAPAVSDAIKAQSAAIGSSLTKAAPANDGNNYIYARSYIVDTTTTAVSSRNMNPVSASGTARYITGSISGFGITFASVAYVEQVMFKILPQSIKYDLYGSLDGVNWYVIGQQGIVATNAGTTQNFTFKVDAIVKYLRIDINDHPTTYGNLKGFELNAANTKGVLEVYKNLDVTLTGEVSATLKTDGDGKVDFSEILAQYPAGEYTYRIDGVNVTNKIADYTFTTATTVTVEKYVAPAGPVVTFKYGSTEIEVESTPAGVYEVPEEFKGDFAFYADSNYKTKFDTTVPVNENTTVYVKAIPWAGYTTKTVEFGIKNTPMSVSFTNEGNGPIVAPRETIYKGDTMVLPLKAYENTTNGLKDDSTGAEFVKVTSLKLTVVRYGTTSDDSDRWGATKTITGTDPTYTFTKAGFYGIRTNTIYGLDAEGNEVSHEIANAGQNCIIEVKEQPTSNPKAAIAPTYTGAEGEVVALLDSDFTKTVAFRKAYGRTGDYNSYDTESVLPLNKKMDYWGTGGDGSQVFAVSQTVYLQFELNNLSYVDNIVLSAQDNDGNVVYPFYDCDFYGSKDGENWYLINSVKSANGTYSVKGVAKFLRLVPRQTDGWNATIQAYTVNGYEVSESALTTTSKTTWVKDGVKQELASEKDLPIAYTSDNKTYAITGWQVDTGAGLSDVSLALIAERNFKELGTLVPVVAEVPVKEASLTGTLAPAGDDKAKYKEGFESDNYINGFYVEGTQIRIPEGDGETAIKGGLRFVNILDNALIAELDAQRTANKVLSYEYGTLAMASTKYTGGDLVIGYNQYTKQVPGERIFASAEDFESKYFKYTVCVTGIDPKYYATDVMVRPYITINMTDGTSVTLYGEQYQTSIYDASVAALNRNEQLNDLTEEEEIHIQAIVDEVEK